MKPFHDYPKHRDSEVIENILNKEVDFIGGEGLSWACKDFIGKLLQKNPFLRLGNGEEGELLGHDWFDDLDVGGLLGYGVNAPMIPELDSESMSHWDLCAESVGGGLGNKTDLTGVSDGECPNDLDFYTPIFGEIYCDMENSELPDRKGEISDTGSGSELSDSYCSADSVYVKVPPGVE